MVVRFTTFAPGKSPIFGLVAGSTNSDWNGVLFTNPLKSQDVIPNEPMFICEVIESAND